ncbi:hypothetical protein [Streptomyces bangladeshensis]|uniref:Uncharacterized protein n=1 Tax=Streptomyces bangladeshensis TaxID=295352 RepID=A0ABP4KAC6_9ACTN
MTLTAIVVLLVGGIATYAAYKDEKEGAALLVGVAVIGLLYLLLGPVPGSTVLDQQTSPGPTVRASPAPASTGIAAP